MKPLLNFENGYVTIELSPFQCADIAQACHFASEYSFDEKIDAWRTLAVLFHACTVVGLTQWQMSKSELEELFEQLARLNLGRDDHSKHNDRRNGHNR